MIKYKMTKNQNDIYIQNGKVKWKGVNLIL